MIDTILSLHQQFHTNDIWVFCSINIYITSFHICAMQFFCFSMLTFKYLAANLSFHIVNLIRTFKSSSTIVKLLPCSNSHGQPYLNSRDNPFITITNNRGLRTDPWWAPTFLYFFFAKTAVDLSFRSCFNIHCLYRLGHSSWTPNFFIGYHSILQGFLSRGLLVEVYVFSFMKVIILHFLKNENGASPSTSWHEAKLHKVYANLNFVFSDIYYLV